jgi:MoaA/NifB/PqqE/SkfB family radical SAM enzyme
MDYLALKTQNRELNSAECLSGATWVKSKPLFFWYDLCGPCNLECKHCGFQVFGRTSEGEISEEVYQIVLAEVMPTAYLCNLGGTNWGEMTISKNFHRFLQDCKKYQVKINLTTNGTRMTSEWFDDLLDTLDVIGFSMEGMGEEFEKLRGFKWRFFLKHVEKVCQGRADRNKKFRVEWRYCAHADNIHQLPDLIRLAKSMGVDRIQMMNLTPYVAAQKFKNLFYHRSLANQYFAEGRKVARELNFDINIPPDFHTGTFELELVQVNGLGGKSCGSPARGLSDVEMVSCYYPWQTCSIDERGKVKPCCIYWRPMGILGKGGFTGVWNNRNYRKLRRTINTNRMHEICYSCRMPRFDSDDSTSNSQTKPGLREMLRNLFTSKRRNIAFEGVFNEDFDPRDNGTSKGAAPSAGVDARV